MPVSGSQPAEPGAAFTYGWNKFKEHWQAVLVALIVGFVIIVVLGVIGYLIQSALTSTDACHVRSTSNGLRFSGGCGDDGPGLLHVPVRRARSSSSSCSWGSRSCSCS